MSDAGMDETLLYQLNRQRVSMLDAVRDYEHRIERHLDRAAQIKAEVERLRIMGERLSAEIGRLEADNDALRATIDEINGSRSWRITRPFRALRRLGEPDANGE